MPIGAFQLRIGGAKHDGNGVDWIYLAQDRHKWWAVVNRGMYVLFIYNAWNLLTG